MLIMRSMRYTYIFMRNISEIVFLGVEIDERTSLIQHIFKLTQFNIYISLTTLLTYCGFRLGRTYVEPAP